jgi:hypothetical protein
VEAEHFVAEREHRLRIVRGRVDSVHVRAWEGEVIVPVGVEGYCEVTGVIDELLDLDLDCLARPEGRKRTGSLVVQLTTRPDLLLILTRLTAQARRRR